MSPNRSPVHFIALITLLTVVAVAVLVTWRRGTPSHRPQGGECREVDGRREVFVKTFDAPDGKWAEVVDADETDAVQFWCVAGDIYLVYHADGKLTYADITEIRKIVRRGGE